MQITFIMLIICFFSNSQQLENKSSATGVLRVHISNLRNTSGQLHVAVFNSHDSFANETPLTTKSIHSKPHNLDTLTVSFQLPEGEYGISVLDDSNADGVLNYGFAGIPREGFGFSGYKLRGLKKPHFKKFSFQLQKGTTATVNVRMTYLF